LPWGLVRTPRESLFELAKLGARLIIQRAVEEEFDAWLGRARYERRPDYQRGLRNGFRPRRVQTLEGELEVEVPQVREAAEPFDSKLFPRATKVLAHRAAAGDVDRRVRPRYPRKGRLTTGRCWERDGAEAGLASDRLARALGGFVAAMTIFPWECPSP